MNQINRFLLSPNLWVSVVFLVICLILFALFRRYVHRRITSGRIKGKKQINAKLFLTVLQFLFFTFAGLVVLQINGIDVSSLVTGLGIGGIVIGFALQDFLKDVIMGIKIVWDEFFNLGDVIKYGEIEGKVIDFNIKVTKVRDIKSGNVVTISNRNISEVEILSDWQIIRVPASYAIPAERMREICKSICRRIEGMEGVTSCTFQGTESFEDSLILYRLLMRCPPEIGYQMRRDALGIVQDVFEENDVAIPFPQLDVHMDYGTAGTGKEGQTRV